jgi:hypothetical protein
MTTNPTRKIAANDTLYFADNGAMLCGRHLGTTAAYTGRGLDGSIVERITEADANALAKLGCVAACEWCEADR